MLSIAHTLGAVQVLQKPFVAEELVTAVARASALGHQVFKTFALRTISTPARLISEIAFFTSS